MSLCLCSVFFHNLKMSNGKETDFNQRWDMAHYTIKISCCIATIKRFRKTVQVRKFVANIGYNIEINAFCCNWNGWVVRAIAAIDSKAF